MKRSFEENKALIKECFQKENLPFLDYTEEDLKTNLDLVDYLTEVVADAMCDFGIDQDLNEYGLLLDDVITYLVRFRLDIVG